MKIIDQIIHCFLATAAVSALVLLCSPEAEAYGPNDQFRVNLQMGCGPNGPGLPIDPNGLWNDVGDWQIYLKTHGEGFYMNSSYPNNVFDNQTDMATKHWQSTHGLPATGIINTTTLTASGLPNPRHAGPPWLMDAVELKSKLAKAKNDDPYCGQEEAAPKEFPKKNRIRIPLGMHDKIAGTPDTPGGPGPENAEDPNGIWNDVTNWQVFLRLWEDYISKLNAKDDVTKPLYPGPDGKRLYQWMRDPKTQFGTFDENTKWATRDFQFIFQITPIYEGEVDEATLAEAKKPACERKQCPLPNYPTTPHPFYSGKK